jgi:hypothetical protein
MRVVGGSLEIDCGSTSGTGSNTIEMVRFDEHSEVLVLLDTVASWTNRIQPGTDWDNGDLKGAIDTSLGSESQTIAVGTIKFSNGSLIKSLVEDAINNHAGELNIALYSNTQNDFLAVIRSSESEVGTKPRLNLDVEYLPKAFTKRYNIGSLSGKSSIPSVG